MVTEIIMKVGVSHEEIFQRYGDNADKRLLEALSSRD